MVRIRIGESWKHNPSYLTGLRALAEGTGRGFSPRDIVDVLGIEIDGVDLAQGLAEAALLDAMGELVRATRALAGTDGEERVRLARAPVELKLTRQGDELHLALRVLDGDLALVRDASVEPRRFFEAVRHAARTLLSDLTAIHPALGALRVVRALSIESVRPARRRSAPRPPSGPPVLASTPVGPYRLVAHAGPTGLVLCDKEGKRFWTSLDEAGKALGALRAALTGGAPWPGDVRPQTDCQAVVLGRAKAVPLADLARAATAIAVTLARGAAAPEVERALPRGRLDRGLGALPPANTHRSASIRAPGMPAQGLRKLILRPSWRADAPGPGPRLARASGLVLVLTGTQVEARRPDGCVAWTMALRDSVATTGAEPPLLVGREAPNELLIVDPATGQKLGRVRAPLSGPLQQAASLGGGLVAVSDGGRIAGLDPAQRHAAWLFQAGTEGALKLCVAGAGLLVATQEGDLTGLGRDGAALFRTPRVLDRTREVRVDRNARLALLSGQDESGAAALAAVSLVDGRIAWRRVLQGLRPSAPVLVSTRVAVGFESSDGPALAAFDARSGRPRFQALVPPDGPVAPFATGRLFGVPRLGGGLCLYALDGTRVAHARAADPDPALSPVRPRPVRTGAGLILVASALIHVYDASHGRLLASLEPAELAPEELALFDGPLVAAAGRDGLVEAWRAHGHLRLVD